MSWSPVIELGLLIVSLVIAVPLGAATHPVVTIVSGLAIWFALLHYWIQNYPTPYGTAKE